ncbi:4Fe-4S dicluster domain-containing protein [Neomoorella thermoacetica]|uniref:4Fe-4S dicluster domain-containing protein n=1 Tax=Neomoorella thermoacetica TaxID=1525 RepID=UPI0008FAE139|nr:ferredoxin family protein [Moorella thermoacetica]OIQ62672.1 2-oxoglutarate-acceptor oxidoreductase subunit OorD [Moorella thermoacetica]
MVQVDPRACKECGYCTAVCSRDVFAPAAYFNERGYKPMLAAYPERCTGCGQCFYICPDFAISIDEPDKGLGV